MSALDPAGEEGEHVEDRNSQEDLEPELELEPELDAAAIAAAMGFSSFGAQPHASKKRRFNPRADAVVAAAGRESGGRRDRRDRSAAAAAVAGLPLHPPQGPPRRTNETDLEEDGQEATGEGRDPEAAAESDPEPQYIDTSRPVGEMRHLGESIDDAFLARGHERYGLSTAAAHTGTGGAAGPESQAHQLDGSALSKARTHLHPHHHDHNHHHHHHHQTAHLLDRHGFRPELAPPPPPGTEPYVPYASRGGSGGSGGGSGMDSGRGERGGGGHQWWADYYDPTSNENPWARLEADRKIPTTWVAQVPSIASTATAASREGLSA